MFGFSLTKLLFTLAAIIVAWNGFKWYNRMQQRRDAVEDGGKTGRKAASGGANASIDAEEMIKCPVCETYVSSAAAVSCGRENCPYPG